MYEQLNKNGIMIAVKLNNGDIAGQISYPTSIEDLDMFIYHFRESIKKFLNENSFKYNEKIRSQVP